MSTMTGNRRRAVLWGLAGLCVAAVAAGTARAADPANVVSDRSGAILIYPKIVVDTRGELFYGKHVDTELQLTNTSKSVIGARCYMIDGTHRCSNDPRRACLPDASGSVLEWQCTGKDMGEITVPNGDSSITCVPPSFCQERDFTLTLTKRQPISWKASEGLNPFPCNGNCWNEGGRDGDNEGSAIFPTGDPFMGEIRCVEVNPENEQPTTGFNPINDAAGDLKGEATIVTVTPRELGPSGPTGANGNNHGSAIDARKYNAIALEATNVNNGDDVLCLGGEGSDQCPDGPEYAGCPNILLMDHMFENARPKTGYNATWEIQKTDLTIVPCGWDFLTQTTVSPVIQYLVFNEFEQRFSTSKSTGCWREIPLVDIDTRPGDHGEDKFSIFNVYVQGTLTGQTRIRSVASSGVANTVLAVTEEFWDCAAGYGACTDAGNIHFTGRRVLGDTIVLSPVVLNGG